MVICRALEFSVWEGHCRADPTSEPQELLRALVGARGTESHPGAGPPGGFLRTMLHPYRRSAPCQVDDILGEGSDDSDSEKKPPEEEEPGRRPLPEALGAPRGRRLERSAAEARGLRGHKRKLNEEDAASESSGASSCEDEDGGSSEADEMAAALEAELGDLM